jgi:predicted RNA-binding protein with RPS1 domain
MHRTGAVVPVDLPHGDEVRGEVVCRHPFGVGLYLPDQRTYGHVDGIQMPDSVSSPADYPEIGSPVRARVLGVADGRQLRLSLRPDPDRPRPTRTTTTQHLSKPANYDAAHWHRLAAVVRHMEEEEAMPGAADLAGFVFEHEAAERPAAESPDDQGSQ